MNTQQPFQPKIRIFENLKSFASAGANLVLAEAEHAVLERGRFALALSGGQTPAGLYRNLADLPSGTFPWAHTHLFWSDERVVPVDDPRSNYGSAKKLLLSRIPIPPNQVHPIVTHGGSAMATAQAYEALIQSLLETEEPFPPRFDLVLLGLGEDGHTASLFPGSPALRETRRLVVDTQGPEPNLERITFTLKLLNAARQILFLVTGQEKRAAVETLLQSKPTPSTLPAARVRPSNGQIRWFLDRSAAGNL